MTIVELEQDVVDLVWTDCAKDGTFTLVVGDFESWTPPDGSFWDVVWCDTWLVDNPLTLDEYKTAMTTSRALREFVEPSRGTKIFLRL